MTAVFASGDVPVASRSEYWRQVLGEGPVPLEPLGNPDRLPSFRRVVGCAGPLAVSELSLEGRGSVRTISDIRRSGPEFRVIEVVARGHGVVEQGGRQAELRPGDLTVVDLSRPAAWALSEVRCIGVVFPRSLLPLRGDELTQLAAVRIPGDRGGAALLSSLLRQLPEHLDGCDESGGARLGGAVLDLLMAALACRFDRTSELLVDARRRTLLRRTYALIEERLGDPELSPRYLAAAQFVSVRSLHKLFDTEQTTVTEWIRRRRLERCARDLLDPALAGEPIAAISARWGMINPAHFSRLFRTRYGVSPSDYRATGGRPYLSRS